MSSFFQDLLLPLVGLDSLGAKLNTISGTLIRQFQESLSNNVCNSNESEFESCRNHSAALPLKLVALVAIVVASAAGIAIPLLGRRKNFLATDGNLFIAAKAFAAGVILATGFVHMLPDASENLTDSCLPKYPWRKFPFSGFFAMMAALVTLMVDFLGTQIYERNNNRKQVKGKKEDDETSHGVSDSVETKENGFGTHQHDESREGHVVEVYVDHHDHDHAHSHGHSHSFVGDGAARNVVIAQVLELGIVSHSVLIGLSLGVSHSPCTIKPLIAALSFHQFFEGFALGGCIAQAHFKQLSTVIMACFFALTTPAGIAAGIAVASSYNPSSVRALVVEGTLDSISAGILIYMALVDLIAADFMTKKMRSNSRLQVVSYCALFFGASLMAALAIWS